MVARTLLGHHLPQVLVTVHFVEELVLHPEADRHQQAHPLLAHRFRRRLLRCLLRCRFLTLALRLFGIDVQAQRVGVLLERVALSGDLRARYGDQLLLLRRLLGRPRPTAVQHSRLERGELGLEPSQLGLRLGDLTLENGAPSALHRFIRSCAINLRGHSGQGGSCLVRIAHWGASAGIAVPTLVGTGAWGAKQLENRRYRGRYLVLARGSVSSA